MKEMNFTVGGYTGGVLVSTLISIVPFPIDEFKPGLIPGRFHIDPCIGKDPVCVKIGESYHFVYIDAERGNLRVLDPSYDVARAIVADYNSAQLEARPECHPGLFWLLGDWTPEKIRADRDATEKLELIRVIQHDWFAALVKLGDDDWEKTRQHYAISDTQRFAAKALDPLNKQGRQWIFLDPTKVAQEANPVETTLCPSCGSDVVKTAVVCRYCKYILNAEKYATMQFADVGGVNLKKVLEQVK